MIEIEYAGGNSIRIVSNKQILCVDPNRESFGLPNLDFKSSIQLITEPRLSLKDEEVMLEIDSPGEYEVGGFYIKGLAGYNYQDFNCEKKNNTFYAITVEDVKIAILGNLNSKITEEQLEQLGVVDVLILPVGGGGLTLYGKEAAKIVKQVEPKIVIPVHYSDGVSRYAVPQDGVEEFNNELGIAEFDKFDKLVIKKITDLPDNLKVVKLSCRR